MLNDPTGIFAKCHSHIPTDSYYLVSVFSFFFLLNRSSVTLRTKLALNADYYFFIPRPASRELVTVAAVCSSACVCLSAAM